MSNRKRVNILLTSVGRRVELVRAFRQAYVDLNIEGKLVATDIDPLAPAMREVDIPIVVPRFHETTFVPTLTDVCELHAITAVFPLIDPDIPILAAHSEILEESGAKLAVVDTPAAGICSDKWLATDFFERTGLASPTSWLPGTVDCSSVEFPLFIKPRDGSAAQNTYRVNNEEELRFFEKYVPNAIIQEFLPGPEVTSDIVCDMRGNVLSIVSRQRVSVRGGEVVKGFTVYDERITDACETIAMELPARGPITAQCMMKDGIPHFIEINGRLGGGIPLAIAAGVDVAGLLLSSLAGDPLPKPEPGSYIRGLHMARFDSSFFTEQPQHVKARSHHL